MAVNITYREEKGSPLTSSEIDNNFKQIEVVDEQVEELKNTQFTSFVTVKTYADLPNPGIEGTGYYVMQDPDPSNNGMWGYDTAYYQANQTVNSGPFDDTDNVFPSTQFSNAEWTKIGINYNSFFAQQVSFSTNFRTNIYSNFKEITSTEGFKGRKLFLSQFNWEPLGAENYTTFMQVSENIEGADYVFARTSNISIPKTTTGLYDITLNPEAVSAHPDAPNVSITVTIDLDAIQKTSNYYFPSQDNITPSFNECGILPIDKDAIPSFEGVAKKSNSLDVNRSFNNENRVVGEFVNGDNLTDGSVIKTDYLYYDDANVAVTDFIDVNEGDVIEYNGYMTGGSNMKVVGYSNGEPIENYLFNGGATITQGEFTVGFGIDQIKACCYVAYKADFTLINLTARANELVGYESGKTTIGGNYKCYKNQILGEKTDLVEGWRINYGSDVSTDANYGLTDYIQIVPGAEIQFVGILQNYNSICGFDADGNFVEPYVRTLNTQPLTYAGVFTPSKNVRSIRACALYSQPFHLYYTESVKETFERDTFRDYLIDDLKEQTLVGRVNMKAIGALPSFTDIIKLNPNAMQPYVSVIGTESKCLYSKPKLLEYRDMISDDTTQNLNFLTMTKENVMLMSAGSKMYMSDDKFATNSLLQDFIPANGFEDGNVLNCFQTADGSLFSNFQLSEARRTATGKEIYIYKGTQNGDTWNFNTTPVLELDWYGDGAFSLVGTDWGNSSMDNIVVFSDYGTQGFAGHVWLSQDYGETFAEIFDLYDGSLSEYGITGGHVHSSNYDAYYNRIWVCTGDGQNNTYNFWSDDLGATWDGVEVPFENETYNQFVTIRSYKDYVLFQTDNRRNGVWRYNRNNKNETPVFEWASDIYNYDNPTEVNTLAYTGNGITQWGINSPIVLSFGDHGYESGVKGVVICTFDGLNYYELYRDETGGMLSSSVAFEDEEFMYISNLVSYQMAVFTKPFFQ